MLKKRVGVKNMPEGRFGGPRPFAECNITLEVRMDGVIISGDQRIFSKLSASKNKIEEILDKQVGDVGFDETTDTATIEIKDTRITPKEANAAGDIVKVALQANEKDTVITV